MDDDEDESKRPSDSKRKGLDYFGLFLLVSSLSIFFIPGLAGELYLLALAILPFSMVLLIVNTVFQSFEKRRADRSPSQPTPNWRINLKVVTITLVLCFVPIIIALLLD